MQSQISDLAYQILFLPPSLIDSLDTSLFLKTPSLDASHSYLLFSFSYLLLSCQSPDIAMVSFLYASLGFLCHLGFHLRFGLVISNSSFPICFFHLYTPIPKLLWILFSHLLLKTPTSSCHSFAKNCSGFLLHPTSCYTIGPSLPIQFYFFHYF